MTPPGFPEPVRAGWRSDDEDGAVGLVHDGLVETGELAVLAVVAAADDDEVGLLLGRHLGDGLGRVGQDGVGRDPGPAPRPPGP